ncbi:OmpA family protein [Solitalea koreensis]|uniref:Outer membrane protein OmpA n=1 Tax=Solitalea koreensis TaxID=543615 RepID=A0A521EFC3_9SPHI|nr:OmpA family protein [Solitalea koreensis]SMO82627.1 Outer membrane protein OmpA [Solitalea koreensis]
MKNKSLKFSALALAFLLAISSVLPSCKNMTGTQKGAAIGAGAGAGVGALIGKAAGNTLVGALIGTAVGGTAGAYIGKYMDKQKKEIEETVPNAKVEEVNNGEALKVTFDSKVLFDINKYALKDQSKNAVKQLNEILIKYPDTEVKILGHTDDTGKDDYNMKLSQQRADAVKDYALSLGVNAKRLTAIGYGESQPIADNTTAEGRTENRRVEFLISANDQLKAKAKQQQSQR